MKRTKGTRTTKNGNNGDRQERPPQRSQPLKNDGLSSEIDIDEIIRLASDVDDATKDEPEPKRTRKVRVSSGKDDSQSETAAPVVVIQPDPEFVEMVQWGVETGVDFARMKLDWSEPGKQWREKVSVIIARLVQRISPVQPGPMADLITLSGYCALWIIPNIAVAAAPVPEAEVINKVEKVS